MTKRTIPPGRWVVYGSGLKVFYLPRKTGETPMEETPTLSLLYVTTPSSSEPTLNIQVGNRFAKFHITKDQLYNLNRDIADALLLGRTRWLPNGQLDLSFEDGRHTEH